MWCGGTVLFQEMRQCPFGERQHSSPHLRNNGIHFRDAAYEVCLWVRARTMGDDVTQHKKWVWLREKWGGPGRHPWHSPLIKTRWHGREDRFTGGVYSSIWLQKEPRPLWVQEKVELESFGQWWGTVRENTLCWCFVWHKSLLTATVNQELCQGSQVSSGIWLRATESRPKGPEARLEVSPCRKMYQNITVTGRGRDRTEITSDKE